MTDAEAEISNRVIFVKSRPQNADILKLVQSTGRVFIGYPPEIKDAPRNETCLSKCILNLRDAADNWKESLAWHHPAMTSNKWFAQSVSRGWIVAIPRPGDGVCWFGEIGGQFELIDNPAWYRQYLDLRRQQGLECDDENFHIGDVAQSWPLNGPLVPIAFGLVPRWISYRLLSRPTIGTIDGFPELGLDAHRVLKSFIEHRSESQIRPTHDLDEIERRLLTFTSPAVFEHLCVSLLQLECPNEIWWHTGGAGDGGADGLGYSEDWTQKGLLQCKWHFGGNRLSDEFKESGGNKYRMRVLAALIHGDVDHDVEGAEFWGRRRIAELVSKHAENLPFAKTLRIFGH